MTPEDVASSIRELMASNPNMILFESYGKLYVGYQSASTGASDVFIMDVEI